MDDLRFDRLTRRFVVSGLGGGSLIGLLGLGERTRSVNAVNAASADAFQPPADAPTT